MKEIGIFLLFVAILMGILVEIDMASNNFWTMGIGVILLVGFGAALIAMDVDLD
jgi:hypothetical protein